jgi:hypothetical protein
MRLPIVTILTLLFIIFVLAPAYQCTVALALGAHYRPVNFDESEGGNVTGY